MQQKRPLRDVPQLGGTMPVPPEAAAAAAHTAHAAYEAASAGALMAHSGGGWAADATATDPAAAALAARGLAPSATVDYKDYKVLGGFAQVAGGRFLNPDTSGENYWETKGIPKHRDERQMGNYFDFSAWQDEQNERKRRGAPTVGVRKKRVV